MSTSSYPYSQAHAHTVDLMKEISELPDMPIEAILFLGNIAKTLADKVRELR